LKLDVIFSGFGGQGVLVTGQLLAQAGMLEDKHVTYLPIYGSEVRGGTASSTVIISDRKIFYPYIEKSSNAVVFNRPSLDRYEPVLPPGGILVINSSMAVREAERNDINSVYVPATTMASEMGNEQVTNLIMLGAFIAATEVVQPDSVMAALKLILPERRHNLLPLNREALEKGMAVYNQEHPAGTR